MANIFDARLLLKITNVFLLGFGHIGQLMASIAIEHNDFELVAINNLVITPQNMV